MKPLLLVAAASFVVAAAGCVRSTPSICQLADSEIVTFPDDRASDVPTDHVVRVLVAGSAYDLDVFLTRVGAPESEPGVLDRIVTGYGDVLELRPDWMLEDDTEYQIEIADPVGIVYTSFFYTGYGPDGGAPTSGGRVDITPLTAHERSCCSGGQCRDGTEISIPAPPYDTYYPQLLLLEVTELYNDRCGPAEELVAVVPVVYGYRNESRLYAETDALLEGCYRVTVVDQALRADAPDGVVCTPGYDWVPAPVDPDCLGVGSSGCHCRGAAPGAADVLLAIGVFALLVVRRRTVA